MIDKLELKSFTTFDELAINFSPKINIIIGENGTGKTHLLKAAYTLCSCNTPVEEGHEADDGIKSSITTKLRYIFKPLDDKLWKIRKHGSESPASLAASFLNDQHSIRADFNTNSQQVAIEENENFQTYRQKPVFIPTKEVLSFMKGFSSLYSRYELSFDQTYKDICDALDLPEIRQENLHEKSKWAIEEIEKICNGKFIFQGGGNVIFKQGDAEFSANAMAEGFRKIGMLSRLLETGAIQPGLSGPLFWDEPETNINPKLMKLLVEILIELSRNGQQIIIATHDYVFLKWFEILCDTGQDDHICFHTLYQDEDLIKIESVDNYYGITRNAISNTYDDLTKAQIKKKMGNIVNGTD